MIQIKALANTDTAEWCNDFVKVYCNNYLAGQENEGCIGKAGSELLKLLKVIMQNLLLFGRVSLFVVGDFFQLPRSNQISVFMKSSEGSYRSFNRWLLEKSQLQSWLRLFSRAVIQVLFNYLLGLEKVTKQILM